MLPWVQLASAIAPDGDTLRLMRRGDEFSIRLQGGNELMNSRLGGSEEALATLALDRLADRLKSFQDRFGVQAYLEPGEASITNTTRPWPAPRPG